MAKKPFLTEVDPKHLWPVILLLVLMVIKRRLIKTSRKKYIHFSLAFGCAYFPLETWKQKQAAECRLSKLISLQFIHLREQNLQKIKSFSPVRIGYHSQQLFYSQILARFLLLYHLLTGSLVLHFHLASP